MKKNNNLLIGIIIAVTAFLFLGVFGFGGRLNSSYGMMPMMGFGWIFMFLIFVVLILSIMWLIKQLQEDKK